MNSFSRLTLTAFFWLLTAVSAAASSSGITPLIGLCQPIGSGAQGWNGGYALGLQVAIPQGLIPPYAVGGDRGGWSVVASFQRMRPNAEAMLKTGGRELKVEQSEGSSIALELGLLAQREVAGTQTRSAVLELEFGAGLYYVRDAEVHVKGSYTSGATALTRNIFAAGQRVVVPGVSAGLSARLRGSVAASIRLRHLFTAGSGRDLLLVGVGLLPE